MSESYGFCLAGGWLGALLPPAVTPSVFPTHYNIFPLANLYRLVDQEIAGGISNGYKWLLTIFRDAVGIEL